MNSDEYLTSMDNRMKIKEMLEESTNKTRGVVEKFIQSYLLIFLAVISIGGLGFMLFREIRYIMASAECPSELTSPIEAACTGHPSSMTEDDCIANGGTWIGPVIMDVGTDYNADNVIDCHVVDITIKEGGILRILPNIVDNDSHEDDFGIVMQANSFTIEPGGVLDLEGQGYGPGQQSLHEGSGKSSVDTCTGGLCGGSGGGHGGAGGRGDPDGSLVSAAAGEVYGSKESPLTLGSGGGESAASAAGGSGGGAVKLEVSGAFTNNGTINASGTSGEVVSNSGGGGGAGGSIWIEAGSFAGSGIVEANGGDGGEASKVGGGGGGGRVVMRCQNGNTYTGNGQVTVNEGVGGIQDGQVGTLIGPSCYPPDPTDLAQYESGSSVELEDGKGMKVGTMDFKFMVSDIESESKLTPQVELREVGEAFTGAATSTGTSVAYAGIPVEATVTVGGIVKTKEYKWRARVKDEYGVYSEWVDYETLPEEEIDFLRYGDPALMVKIDGDNQTGTVGQALANPFIVEIRDSVGHVIPNVSISWQVKAGGGSMSEGTTLTGENGRTSSTLTLGPESGTDNNTVDAVRTGVSGSPMRFTASADPGILHHYFIDTPSVVLVDTNFSPAVEIEARDQYENLVTSANNSVNLGAVLAESGCPDTCNPGTGNLTPSQVTLSSGEASISNMQYSAAESIKVKADDGSQTGYSTTVNVVTEYGSCFGVANIVENSPLTLTQVDSPWIFDADPSNGGIINCSNIDVIVESGATVELGSYDSGDSIYTNDLGVQLIAKSLDVQSTAELIADGAGYGAGRGPGYGGGAGYGGYGAGGASIYGSVYEPGDLGSGGTHNGGGGAIKIVTSGNLINNGTITSDSIYQNYTAPGSGGSIWLDVGGELIGGGTIKASSAAAGWDRSGGAGGRIAIYYGTDSSSSGMISSLGTGSPTIYAYGTCHSHGCENGGGGGGTIYVEHKGVDTSRGGSLYADNNGNNLRSAGLIEDNYKFEKVTLTRQGHLDVEGEGSVLTVTGGSGLTGDGSMPDLTMYGTFNGPSSLTVNGVDVGIKGDLTLGSDNSNSKLLFGKYTGCSRSIETEISDEHELEVDEDMVALWHMNEESGSTVADSSGNGNDGTASGTTIVDGKYGNARSFDSANQLITFPGLDWTPQAFSVEFWIYPQALADYNQSICTTNGWGTFCFHTTSNGEIYVGTDESNRLSPSELPSGTLVAGQWQHFVFTFESGVGGLYKNGELLASKNMVASTAWEGFQIGLENSNTVNGLIDDVAVYNEALSEDEIIAHSLGFTLEEYIGSDETTCIENGGVWYECDDPEAQCNLAGGLTLYANTWAHDRNNQYTLGDIVVGSNGTVTLVSYDSGDSDYTNDYGLGLTVDTVTVEEGGVITANSKGYQAEGRGPGGYTNCGGGHGGYGRNDGTGQCGAIYGDVYEPQDLGSNVGGGAVKLVVNSLTNAGTISSNGKQDVDTAYYSGSGGSIWIDVGNISNTGVIQANGGKGVWSAFSAAGGGRIAVYYETGDVNRSNIEAYGGYGNGGSKSGGPGTIYIEQEGVDVSHGGKLYVDNTGVNGGGQNSNQAGIVGICSVKEYTDKTSCEENGAVWDDKFAFSKVHLTQYGHLDILGEGTGCSLVEYYTEEDCTSNGGTWDGGSTLTVTGSSSLSGDDTIPDLTVYGTFNGPTSLTINGVDVGIRGDLALGSNNSSSDLTIGEALAGGLTLYANTWAYNEDSQYTLGDVAVGSNGTMTLVSYDSGDSDYANDYGFELDATNITVDTGGIITADGKGYATRSGPGYDDGGASHGGYGISSSASPYGDLYRPNMLGSGASQTSGGGAYKLDVSENLLVDGTLSSSSFDGFYCGTMGSGGSIWIEAKNLSGDGVIRASGGDTGCGNGGIGGAGGRVAIYYETDNSTILNTLNTDSPKVQAFGGFKPNYSGWGDAIGGPGTVYIRSVSDVENIGEDYMEGNLYIGNNPTYSSYLNSRGMNFSSQSWKFNDMYVGKNVKLKMEGEKDTLPEGFEYPDLPDAHELAVEENTLALWHMNETANGSCSGGEDVCDSSSSSYQGTVNGTSIVAGKYSNARSFSGTGEYVNINQDDDFDFGSENFAVEFWVSRADTGNIRNIAGKWDGSQGWYIQFKDNNKLFFDIYNNSSNRISYTSTTSYTDVGEWHHIVCQRIDISTTKCYVDGEQDGTLSSSGSVSAISSSNLYIGGYNSSQYFFSGTIDEVAIYDRALSENEIKAHYYGLTLEEYQNYLDEWNNVDSQRVGRGVTFDLTGDFTLSEGAILDGTLEGFETDSGPEPGGVGAGNSAGGGGAHGGAGGLGQDDTVNDETQGGQGNNYDSPVLPMNLGSGGGSSGTGAEGGVGGGAVSIETEDGTININGEIDVSGGDGAVVGDAGGGGGAGGSIYLKACDLTLGATGVLNATGGDAGVSTYVGGGGGGGIIVLAHTCLSTVTLDPASVIDKDEGTGYQAGGEGIYGLYGMPNIYSQDQYTKADQKISVGAEVDERAVKFKFDVIDPDAMDTLTPQVEVLESGDGTSFSGTNIMQGSGVAWSGGSVPVELEVLAEKTNGQGSINNVLGITSDDLMWGEDYKWRGRVIDGNGVASDWVEFGDNNDGTDFQIASVPTCGNGVLEYGEECDGSELNGETCESQGYPGGTLSCTGSCTLDTGGCWECGNGVIEPGNGEQCDDPELGGLTCTDFDEFIGGILGCNASCQYETGSCTPGYCGDGIQQSWEECDDGNTDNGDGCSAICEVEDLRYCGDGTTDEDLGEECDDGNSENGDGCSNICEIEDITGYCGDGVKDEDEECDDGNQANGDGCSNVCTIEIEGAGYCGDGNLDEGEGCDDGNQTSGDGCSNTCRIEVEGAGYCGDGNLDAGEGCDDGNQTSGDGCSNVCTIESLTVHYCGDGTKDEGEECDDGNQKNGDGCNNKCEIEPNEETAVCGNGVIEPGEQCDGDEFGSIKCESFFGFIGGSRRLECTDECKIDVTGCIKRGEGIEIFGLPLTGDFQMIALVSANILSVILAIIAVILGFPSLLFRREKKPWGVVYDKVKEKPVAFATVRIFSRDKLVEQKVTDLEGRYGFTVKSGDYDLEVTHGSYEKFREKVTVGGKEEGSVNRDVALAPKSGEKAGLSGRIKNLLAKAREIFPRISKYTYVLGLVFSIIATIISPVVYNFVIIGFYALVAIVYWLFGMKKGDGKVYDAGTGNGIEGAFVRVFNAKDNKLIDNQMTYEDGSYMFILEPGKFYLLASKKGYKFPSTKEEKKIKKAFYGSLVEAELKKGKTLSENLAMDKMGKGKGQKPARPPEEGAGGANGPSTSSGQAKSAGQKKEKFGSPFGN